MGGPRAGAKSTWSRCYDFENFSPKNLAFFAQTTASFFKKFIITLFFFKKNVIFFAENCDHNIDPGGDVLIFKTFLQKKIRKISF
jgi:hypothetical protein